MTSADVFSSIPLPWNGLLQLGWEEWGVLYGYLRAHTTLSFFCLPCKLILANNMISFFVLFPLLWCVPFPFHCFPIFSSLPFTHPAYNLLFHVHLLLLILAGHLRLQQIVNPVDPLEILADVHWTHIREKEEEEKMVPTSKSSTSRGNLPQAIHHQFLEHHCSCLTLLSLRPSRAVHLIRDSSYCKEPLSSYPEITLA